MVRTAGKEGSLGQEENRLATVFVDIDGVLADFITPLLQMGYPYPEDYYFSNLHPVDRGKVKRLLHDSDFLSKLEPYEGTQTSLKKLYESGSDVRFITARPNSCHRITEEWLEYHYSFIRAYEGPKIVFARDKGGWLARNLPYLEGTTFVVEDAPHQALGASLAGVRYVYLVHHEYNKWLGPGKQNSIIRVESLSEAVKNILLTSGLDEEQLLWD